MFHVFLSPCFPFPFPSRRVSMSEKCPVMRNTARRYINDVARLGRHQVEGSTGFLGQPGYPGLGRVVEQSQRRRGYSREKKSHSQSQRRRGYLREEIALANNEKEALKASIRLFAQKKKVTRKKRPLSADGASRTLCRRSPMAAPAFDGSFISVCGWLGWHPRVLVHSINRTNAAWMLLTTRPPASVAP